MNYCKRASQAYEVTISNAVAELPPEWNQLLPQDHFLKSEQLLITEESRLPDLDFFYALVKRNGMPVAAAYFQVLNIKPYHVDSSRLSNLQRCVWYSFAKAAKPKLLVAGHLFRHDIASFFSKDILSPFETYQCYNAAIEAVFRHSCASAILVKDMPQELITYFQHYAPQYILLRNDISMEMEVNPAWTELKGYEKSLKHKYAQRLRKIRQSWDALTIKELNAADVENHKQVIFDLYNQVSKKQQVRLGILNENFLPLLKKNYPDDFFVWLALENEQPVAFFSAWSREELFDMFYIGFDYSRNDSLQLYFNILFFSVEQAIRMGKKKLILGRTALEAKARIGCKPVYLSTFLYIKNPLVRSLMLRAQQSIAANEGEWENRHPFK